jgi:hypothetical protein
MALYELSPDGSVLVPLTTAGIPSGVAPIVLGEGALALAVATGEVWLWSANECELAGRPVSACVPLKVGGRVTGVLVLFRPAAADAAAPGLELLEVVGIHAGTALHTTRGRAGEGRRAG